jgi:acyl carrier protein
MEKDRFLALVKEQMDEPSAISLDTPFEQLKGWDSLTTMLVITAIKEQMAVDLTVQDIKSCKTIEDIYNKTMDAGNAR